MAPFLFTGCVICFFDVPFFSFENNSDKFVEVLLTLDYPDTTITSDDTWRYSHVYGSHVKGDFLFSMLRDNAFKRYPTIQLYVFEIDSLQYYRQSFDSILTSELRRYELTKEWMEEHNWTVTYP